MDSHVRLTNLQSRRPDPGANMMPPTRPRNPPTPAPLRPPCHRDLRPAETSNRSTDAQLNEISWSTSSTRRLIESGPETCNTPVQVPSFLTSGEEDRYSVTVPDGTYTFATAGQVGACGLGIQANTNLELFDSMGTPVASNDDGSGYDYCGQVTQTLSAGTYDVRVTGSTSVPFRGTELESGFYRVFVQQ